MGERADGIPSAAWSGGFLDWEAVFGEGFDSAPADWVSVFRELSHGEMVRAARQGLSVTLPELRLPGVRREMELLDSFRPEAVVRRGISRLLSISAAPSPEEMLPLPGRQEGTPVEILVDPRKAFVADTESIAGLSPFAGSGRLRLERFRGAFRRYWDSLIPLGDFLDGYERLDFSDGSHWVARSPVAGGQRPNAYLSPEVLVMLPVVSRRHIRLY